MSRKFRPVRTRHALTRAQSQFLRDNWDRPLPGRYLAHLLYSGRQFLAAHVAAVAAREARARRAATVH